MIKRKETYLLIALLFVIIFCEAQNLYNSKDYWIDKYLSVSYPLKSIQVTSQYGMRIHPITRVNKMHSGIDLKANYEETYAMFDGVVKSVGQDNSNGKYVILKCGNYTLTYCHLSRIEVKKHQVLLAGDIIGLTGSTGMSTGAHLHLSCKKQGKTIDPLIVFDYVAETRKIATDAINALSSVNIAAVIKSRKDFLSAFANNAIREQKKYGIPSSVTLSQMALESGWGQSNLAKKANNYFGIRATDKWIKSGKPYYLVMERGRAMPYCMFNSPQESIEEHSKILMSDRYWKCRLYDERDFHSWLVNIQRAGYAAANNYVQLCEKIIHQNKLYLLDYQC